ncbi:MAG TPA: hypothetical protein VGO36_08060 [Solirubrobacterales bacterium]|jgi:hypothetical protein|nr:hypothetical protein [Solirubrobacterales bacterium]
MSTSDIGESLVGAYMRHVEKCSIVTYNNFFPDRQGEIDVVAVRPAKKKRAARTVFLCEVTIHIDGMDAEMAARVPGKMERLREFAESTFPGEDHVFQWWSPRVPKGPRTTAFEDLKQSWAAEGRAFEPIFNEDFTARMVELVESARGTSSTTGEPAYRMLQILTHLRGDRPTL